MYQWYAFSLQFNTWMVFLTTVLISSIIWVILWNLKISSLWWNLQQEGPHNQTTSDQVLYMFGAVFSQGNPRLPVCVVLRIIHASYWIFLVVLVSAYISQLVALRAITKISLPINSLKELAESPVYKASIPAGTALFDYFRLATDGPFKEIWDKKLDGNPQYWFEPNMEAMLELVPTIHTSRHVMVTNTDKLKYVIAKTDNCDVAMADERIFGGHMTLAGYKGFPDTKLFNER